MWTGRWAWALIPYPILLPSLISHTVSVDVKHYERRRSTPDPIHNDEIQKKKKKKKKKGFT